MPLLGKAAVAMWWDMAPAHRNEFEDWHSHEHFPERLSIPGFLRGARWANASGGNSFFILYELAVYETLTSPGYFARLNSPTPWSTKMMPHHSNMVRSQCQVIESHGGGLGGHMLTIRLSPAPDAATRLNEHLRRVLSEMPQRPGLTGAHLLQTQTPQAAATTEQKIRGGKDAVADWIVLVSGYDAQVLLALGANEFGEEALSAAGAMPAPVTSLYRLAYTLTPADL